MLDIQKEGIVAMGAIGIIAAVVIGFSERKECKTVPTDEVKKTVILADTIPQNRTISTQEKLQQLKDTVFYKDGKEIGRTHHIKPDTIRVEFYK